MAMNVEQAVRQFLDKLVPRVRSGIVFTGASIAVDEVTKRFARRPLREFGELGVGLGLTLVADILPAVAPAQVVKEILGDVADAGFDYSIRKVAEYKLLGVPLCYPKDPNTIRCINLDPASVAVDAITVKIDGSVVKPAGVTGSVGDFDISLPSPLAEGEHELVVVANRKAFYGKIWVPAR